MVQEFFARPLVVWPVSNCQLPGTIIHGAVLKVVLREDMPRAIGSLTAFQCAVTSGFAATMRRAWMTVSERG